MVFSSVLFFPPSQAKCPWLLIRLHGTLDGDLPSDLHLDFAVASMTPGDSRKSVRQESTIHGSNFEGTIYFDTFEKMRDGGHVCARQPGSVAVRFVQAERTIAVRTLTIKNDFKRTEEGDFEILQPLVVQIPSGKN
jgi:hypothetical protein